jgi:hypothetical protein
LFRQLCGLEQINFEKVYPLCMGLPANPAAGRLPADFARRKHPSQA